MIVNALLYSGVYIRDFKILTTERIRSNTTEHYGRLNANHSKSSFIKQDYGVFICFLLCIYTFLLTVLMLNKFTYSHEHTFNRRNQDYD